MQKINLINQKYFQHIKIMKQNQQAQSGLFVKQPNKIVIDFKSLYRHDRKNLDCLLILNGRTDKKWLQLGMKNSQNIILVDGGANYIYEGPYRDLQHIKSIMGDLDSIKPQVRQYYQGKNIPVLYMQDQNYNDLEKSLKKLSEQGSNSFLCFGALGGRLDQTFSSLHTAYKYGRSHPDMQLILLGDQNLIIYIRPNIEYKIIVNQNINRGGCGMITFNKIEKMRTKGFKWDLGPELGFQSLEWANFISTSNHIMQDQLTIFSSDQLFFVCQLNNSG